ncbi:hypothetical protein [Desulfomonile tiedjei]|uniref:Uncharacterized protein n=1 Tax=Desulfomonile tiedjei (strain ATCC 49306 / DSM 6799 / DCB-1) TaxID=706587 RepID=I4C1R5_DESTA|nr:hypothetical protein [Desulfomonile tiedjei]AFM23506.1 hypothetical protein Desti_0781 [Desulfomonile tiedjei DSM 6799]
MKTTAFPGSLPYGKKKVTSMYMLLFYVLACVLMALSTVLAGIQWTEANGVGPYIRLLLNKPFIIIITVTIFVLSGILTQIGKFHFDLSYYKISIIWFATSWVSLIVLWLCHGIKPCRAELLGLALCHLGLAVSIVGRTEQGFLP